MSAIKRFETAMKAVSTTLAVARGVTDFPNIGCSNREISLRERQTHAG